MIKSVYHDGLLDQSVAVLAHVLQDLVSSIVAGCCCGFGGHSQRVDQSLEVNNPIVAHHFTIKTHAVASVSYREITLAVM